MDTKLAWSTAAMKWVCGLVLSISYKEQLVGMLLVSCGGAAPRGQQLSGARAPTVFVVRNISSPTHWSLASSSLGGWSFVRLVMVPRGLRAGVGTPDRHSNDPS